jgi:uracil-DNA glycosylase
MSDDQQFSLFDVPSEPAPPAQAPAQAPAKTPAKTTAKSTAKKAAASAEPIEFEFEFDRSQIPHSAKMPIPPGTYLDMADMTAHCSACNRCDLGSTRTNAVISRGNPNADILIIGEGPGENEDLQGKPFVGKSGQLLDKILASVNLTEADVFICNIVKCRPPGNRKPSKDEMEACRPYLLEQIRMVDPKIIILTGASSIEGLFQEKSVGITKIRGQWRDWNGIDCIPIFHPSYLLRNQSREQGSPKWLTWQDMQEVRRKFDEHKAAEAF